jgi:streptogramin lyase
MKRRRFVLFLAVGALWVSVLPGEAQGSAGAIGFGGTMQIHEFPVPTPNSRPYQIVAGPDGNLWFTQSDSGSIGKITPSGEITEYKIRPGSGPYGITVGPDGNIWFTERFANMIAKFSPAGQLLAEYPVPTPRSQPWGITVGPDGALWFTEEDVDQIGRITVDGSITEFFTQNCCFPTFITTGGDGRLWFTEELPGQIGAMSTNGDVEYFTPPTAQLLYGITTDSNGVVWFTGLAGDNKLGKIESNGQITEFPVPSENTGIAGVTEGSDGNIWFTQNDVGRVGGIRPDGRLIGLYDDGSYPIGIAAGPDGNIWITESQSNAIGLLYLRLTKNASALRGASARTS